MLGYLLISARWAFAQMKFDGMTYLLIFYFAINE
jgi:hypothetical protein